MKRAVLILLAGAVSAGACAPRPRVVKQRPWAQELGNSAVVASVEAPKEILLEVSKSGKLWEWYAEPEKVVEQLFRYIQQEPERIERVLRQYAAAAKPSAAFVPSAPTGAARPKSKDSTEKPTGKGAVNPPAKPTGNAPVAEATAR